MKDLTEVIDLVEGRETGAEVAENGSLSPETPASLHEKVLGVLAVWHVLSDEARQGLSGAIERAAKEAVRR